MGINSGQFLKDVQSQSIIREDNLRVGSKVKVYLKIIEGKRERIQIFEGLVIDIHGSGTEQMFKVRKLVGNIGVERTFPLQNPLIQKIEIVQYGKVRRAKLFYLRNRIGKSAGLKNATRKSLKAKNEILFSKQK